MLFVRPHEAMSALHIPIVHTMIGELLGVADINRMMETERDITSALLELLRIRRLLELQQQLRAEIAALYARAAGLHHRMGDIQERIDGLL